MNSRPSSGNNTTPTTSPPDGDLPRSGAEMAERYRAIINLVDVGFCIIRMVFDRDGRPIDYIFEEMNTAFERATGLATATALGQSIRTLVPTHEQHWFDLYGRVALTGEQMRFEQEARGLGRWFNVYACRIGDPKEHTVAVLFDDITARKRADGRRQFLGELAETLASLRDEAAIVRATTESLGRFLNVDRCYFVECFGDEDRIHVSENYRRAGVQDLAGRYALFDFGGMAWWRSYSSGNFSVNDVTTHPLTREKAQAYLALGVRAYMVQPFKQRESWTAVIAVTDATAREWTSDELKLLEDVVARVWPMVERARSDRALADARDALELRVKERTSKLQETIAELESFSYSISHDLRAPLRAMQTYASILNADCGDRVGDDGREYLRRIMAAAERMDRLIRDVLVFSRVTRATMALERIELGSFVAGILETYPGLSVATAEIEIVSPLGAVQANPAGLTQCIANLLGNAIKFVAPGSKPHVRIWSESTNDRLRLFVRDNGVGIAADAQEKIFGMFYQIDQAKDGTGIGLAVVRKAAERMNGIVGVTSTPGQGSTFWIELDGAKGQSLL